MGRCREDVTKTKDKVWAIGSWAKLNPRLWKPCSLTRKAERGMAIGVDESALKEHAHGSLNNDSIWHTSLLLAHLLGSGSFNLRNQTQSISLRKHRNGRTHRLFLW
jgi:hypothetical protein